MIKDYWPDNSEEELFLRWIDKQQESALEKINKYVHKDLAEEMLKCLICTYHTRECDDLIEKVFNKIGVNHPEIVSFSENEEVLKEIYADSFNNWDDVDEPEYEYYCE